MAKHKRDKIRIVDDQPIDGETTKTETPEPEIEYGLPKKDLFRVDEVAAYFSVSDSTIRRWLDHSHLSAEKYMHQIRITRLSIIRLRKSSMLSRRFR